MVSLTVFNHLLIKRGERDLQRTQELLIAVVAV